MKNTTNTLNYNNQDMFCYLLILSTGKQKEEKEEKFQRPYKLNGLRICREKTGPFVRWQNLRNMREIQYELWFPTPQILARLGVWRKGSSLDDPKFRSRWVGEIWQSHGTFFHRIGMISIYRGQQKENLLPHLGG